MSFVNIETKEDSAEKLAQAAGKPTKNFLFAPEFNLLKTKVNEFYDAFVLALNGKKNNAIYITGTTTAVNNANYIANGTFAVSDIVSPVAGSNYKVTVANGLVTIDGTAYDRGSEITRIFDGSVWQEFYRNPFDLVITTAVNIITTKAWRGRVVKIVNGSNNITVTVNHEFTASGTKGSGTVQFTTGAVTVFPMLGTITLLTGVQGSQWQITKREGVANAVNLTLNPQ